MKSLIKITVVLLILTSFTACKKDSRPNYQYMPNMYEPVGYETYGDYKVFPDGQEAMLPADGTIARGYSAFDIENNEVGFQLAKATLMNPIDSTQIDLERGKELFDIYCAICHGKKGDGNSKLSERDLIIPGSYADKDITEGSIYHTIYYGKNTMGSYINQLKEEERWQVVAYVQKLKADLVK